MIPATGLSVSDATDERGRYLAHSAIAIGRRDRLSIGGILRADTVADLRLDAIVNELLPHDADLVLERSRPDVVLVESGALSGGHAWAGTGDPSDAAAARRLLRVLDVARSVGRPAVLWWTGPRWSMPALIPFESRFDLVVAVDPTEDGGTDMAWSPGVQLGRFSPLGVDPGRPSVPVLHVDSDAVPTLRAKRFIEAAIASLAPDDLTLWVDAGSTHATSWLRATGRMRTIERAWPTALPDAYRAHGLFLADPLTCADGGRIPTSTIRQLASGARVVSGPNERLASDLGDWIEVCPRPGDLRDVVAAAAGLGPRTKAELRRLIAALFLAHDTTRAIVTLAHLLAIDTATPRREVCAVARLGDRAEARTFVDNLTTQRYRPTEALIATDDPALAREAIRESQRARIPARALPPPGPGRGLASWAAERTSAGWVWVWSPQDRPDGEFLIDAVGAGLTTGAAAIGRVAGEADTFVSGAGLVAQIVSRQAAASMPGASDRWTAAWADRGATAYAIGTDIETS